MSMPSIAEPGPTAITPLQVNPETNRIQDNYPWTRTAFMQKEDMYEEFHAQTPCEAANNDKKGIQLAIQKLQSHITKVQQYSSRFSNLNSAVSVFINEESGPGKVIKQALDIATGDISGYVKNILGGVRGWVLNEVQKEAKKRLPFLFPGEMPSFLDKLNKGINGISCAFAKIVRGLFGLVGKLLKDLIDKFINGPMCIVENFISKLLDNILGPIISAINAALALITGAVSNLANSLFNALDFITGILNFFDCDDDKDCPVVDKVNLAGTAALAGEAGNPLAVGGASSFDKDGTAATGAPGTANLNTAGGGSTGVEKPPSFTQAEVDAAVSAERQIQKTGKPVNTTGINLF